MTTATPIFRAMMLEFERRRIALGLPMEKFDEFAGLSDRYYAKALHCDKPSGRQAQWATVQVMVDALFPHGFDLEIRPRPGEVISATNLKAKLLQLKATVDPKSQREMMRELGKKGAQVMLAKRGSQAFNKQRKNAGRARASGMSQERRSEIAKMGAKARWSTPQVIEIVPEVSIAKRG